MYNKIKFNLNKDGSIKVDRLFLLDRSFNRKGLISPVYELNLQTHLNSNNEISFTVYKETDGIINSLWNDINELTLVELEGKGIFELTTPFTDDNSTYKHCSGTSLCETELSQTMATLEINTETDMKREVTETNGFDITDEYFSDFPTVLWRDVTDLTVFNDPTLVNYKKFLTLSSEQKVKILEKSSLLHRILTYAPQYDINHVDESLRNLLVIKSWNRQDIQSIFNELAEDLECLFVFGGYDDDGVYKRSISVYDLKSHCLRPSCLNAKSDSTTIRDARNILSNGTCSICGSSDYVENGYGKYTNVFIDTKNLAESIEVTADKDSVKNYFRIEGGDDTITNMIGARNIGGNYMWKFSDYQLNQMSTTLRNALTERQTEFDNLQEKYNSLYDGAMEAYENRLKYESGEMPSLESEGMVESPTDVFQYVFGNSIQSGTIWNLIGNGKVSKAYAVYSYSTADTIAKNLSNYAKLQVSNSYKFECLDVVGLSDDEGVYAIKTKIRVYMPNEYTDETKTELMYDKTFPTDFASATNDDVFLIPVLKAYNMYFEEGGKYQYDSNGNPIYTTEYCEYLNMMLNSAMAKADVVEESVSFNPPMENEPLDGNKLVYGDTKTIIRMSYKYKNLDFDATSVENDSGTTLPLPNNHYTKYCLNRLQSFYDAYSNCSSILSGFGFDTPYSTLPNGTKVFNIIYYMDNGVLKKLYEDTLGKYMVYQTLIKPRLDWLAEKIAYYEDLEYKKTYGDSEATDEWDRIGFMGIKEYLDMETYLARYETNHSLVVGKLWKELCSFKREDTYQNSNYIGTDLDYETLMTNVNLLLDSAKKEIAKTCELNYSISSTISNLYTMKEFESFWNDFELGNYIFMKADGIKYALRLIGVNLNYNDLQHCDLEFSDIVKERNSSKSIADVLSQASSLSTSAPMISRQAKQGEEASRLIDGVLNDSLSLANTRIVTATDQNFTMDKFGITGKKYIEEVEDFSPEQIKIVNNLLCFTDDNWEHTSLALGKIKYYNSDINEYVEDYGLVANAVIGKFIMGERLKLVANDGNVQIDGNGITITTDTSITTTPTYLIKAKDQNDNIIFGINSKGGAVFNGTVTAGSIVTNSEIRGGTIVGGSISIGETSTQGVYNFSVDSNGRVDAKQMSVSGSTYINGEIKICGNDIDGYNFRVDTNGRLYSVGSVYIGKMATNRYNLQVSSDGNIQMGYLGTIKDMWNFISSSDGIIRMGLTEDGFSLIADTDGSIYINNNTYFGKKSSTGVPEDDYSLMIDSDGTISASSINISGGTINIETEATQESSMILKYVTNQTETSGVYQFRGLNIDGVFAKNEWKRSDSNYVNRSVSLVTTARDVETVADLSTPSNCIEFEMEYLLQGATSSALTHTISVGQYWVGNTETRLKLEDNMTGGVLEVGNRIHSNNLKAGRIKFNLTNATYPFEQTVTVDFNGEFESDSSGGFVYYESPIVVATPLSSVVGTNDVRVSVSNVTASNFRLTLYRKTAPTTGVTEVFWFATTKTITDAEYNF